jgi:hypothetical protein
VWPLIPTHCRCRAAVHLESTDSLWMDFRVPWTWMVKKKITTLFSLACDWYLVCHLIRNAENLVVDMDADYLFIYFVHLNTFFWEGSVGFTRLSEGSMAQKGLRTSGVEGYCWIWSHSRTQHSVWLLRTRDRPAAETSTWQHTTLGRERHPCPPDWTGARNPRKRAAANPCLRPGGHRQRRE